MNLLFIRRLYPMRMRLFSSLDKSQREAMRLLQIGTLLEFFDLMLYVHMGVLLNELFFPQYDPRTAALMGALTFCLTFIFRPIGALVFGWIGDTYGRKRTVIITTSMMAVSCLTMALLPTYAQIGMAAAWLMVFCRIAQGMSSMGEIMGAQIYLTETVLRPLSYPAVASVTVCAILGGMLALGVAALVTSYGMNWRYAFWMGTFIAVVGIAARTRLRETPEFLKMKEEKMKAVVAEFNRGAEDEEESYQIMYSWKQRIKYHFKTLLSFFFIVCGYPTTFYLGFMHFMPILRDKFEYSAEDIIHHNFRVSIIMVVFYIFWMFLSSRIHPLKIIKWRGLSFLFMLICLPFVAKVIPNPTALLLIQALIVAIPLDSMPATAVLIYQLPIYSRFTFATCTYAVAQATIFLINSFGMIYLINWFGHFGLWVIALPVTVAYLWAVGNFIKRERALKIYPNLIQRYP